MRETMEEMKDKAQDVKEKAQDRVDDLKDKAQELKDKAQELKDKAQDKRNSWWNQSWFIKNRICMLNENLLMAYLAQLSTYYFISQSNAVISMLKLRIQKTDAKIDANWRQKKRRDLKYEKVEWAG